MRFERRAEQLVPPPADDPGDSRLVALLRAEIEECGPITFARFMQRALYEPELGYYSTSAERQTRAGDFVTAPELHPIFGHALARQLDEMWRRLDEPQRFTLREFGAGSGALALAIAEGLAQIDSPLVERLRYEPDDLSAQRALIERRLRDAGLGRLLERSGPGKREVGGERLIGCVLANEFLDALPFHRVVVRDGRLRELYVGWYDGSFVEREGELSTSALADWFTDAGVELAEGQRAEASPAMLDWVAGVAAALERGYVLVIDYGAEPQDLYAPARAMGTLRAFRGQHVSSDTLRAVGHQDLTAHVDLGALRRAAGASGLDVLGRTSQAEFIVGSGLEEALAQAQAALPDDWSPRLLLRSAVGRLLDPRALGGYAVLVLGRHVPAEPPLRGLAYRLPARA